MGRKSERDGKVSVQKKTKPFLPSFFLNKSNQHHSNNRLLPAPSLRSLLPPSIAPSRGLLLPPSTLLVCSLLSDKLTSGRRS